MKFPMNLRPLVAGWNLLFLHSAPFAPTAQASAQWDRGRYLVEGAGHCGGCHTPLNLLGAEKAGQALAGGVVDGWAAPSLLGLASRETPWTQAQLVDYLQAKVVDGHGTAAGPMRPVSQELARLPRADVDAMAEYLLSLPAPLIHQPRSKRRRRPRPTRPASAVICSRPHARVATARPPRCAVSTAGQR